MPKWKVRYELRDYYTRVVEAETKEEAVDIICKDSYRRHGSDVYDILSTTTVEDKKQRCKFDMAWVGRCKKSADSSGFCSEHQIKCYCCDKNAVRSCGHTSQFVCGVPMCEEHRHHPDG